MQGAQTLWHEKFTRADFDDTYLGLSHHVPIVYTPNRTSKTAFPAVTSTVAFAPPLSTSPLGDLTPVLSHFTTYKRTKSWFSVARKLSVDRGSILTD